MQSPQHAQRIRSSAGCSTSGAAPQPQIPRSSRSQLQGDCLLSHRHCPGLELHWANAVYTRSRDPSNRKLIRRPTAVPCVRADVNEPIATEPLSITKFVAETCLPTRTGKYRVRAYRHSVGEATLKVVLHNASPQLELFWCLQIDGGRTVTEPTCIMTGKPEGKENVSETIA